MFSKTAAYIKAHKILSIIAGIIVIVVAIFIYKKATAAPTETQYVLGTVSQGTIVSTVSGTGQVAAQRELDISPTVSGEVTAVYVNQGDQVVAGQKLMQIDDTDAVQTVQNDEASLASAQLSLQQIQDPDQVTALQTQDSLTEAEQSLAADQVSLEKSYSDGYTAVSNAFIDIPTVIDDINNMLTDSALDAQNLRDLPTGSSYLLTAGTEVGTAKADYATNLSDYKDISPSSATSSIQSLIDETGNTLKDVSTALNETSSYIDYIKSLQPSDVKLDPTLVADDSTVTTDISKINSDLSSVSSSITTIQNSNDTITNDQASVNEKQATISEGGTSPYTLESAEMSVSQQQNNLASAEEDLAKYTITAPFDGTVAQINDLVDDQAGSDAITLVTNQETAVLSLNEIDAAKVNVGDKATLTFDAFPDLTLTGTVGQVDTIGTVTQGVVNYSVTIVFDTQDPDIKPGMSVSAAIITDTAVDTIEVPSSAIQTTSAGASYVLIPQGPTITTAAGTVSTEAPTQQTITVGVSDDTNTQVLSGLTSGEKIVVQTVTGSTAKTTSTSAISLFGGAGGARAGGAIGGAGGGARAGGAVRGG
jgi:HlyD family secretion protein